MSAKAAKSIKIETANDCSNFDRMLYFL